MEVPIAQLPYSQRRVPHQLCYNPLMSCPPLHTLLIHRGVGSVQEKEKEEGGFLLFAENREDDSRIFLFVQKLVALLGGANCAQTGIDA